MVNPRVFIQTMIALASASLGLVAAVAWNEAIKAMLELGDNLSRCSVRAPSRSRQVAAGLIWHAR